MAQLLGVKPETVYAYVSRGLLTPVARRGARGSWFDLEEIEAHRAAHRPNRRRPEVRIESRLTLIDGRAPYYRGLSAIQLSRSVTFEAVAELLWTGRLPAAPAPWRVRRDWLAAARAAQRLLSSEAPAAARLRVAAAAIGAEDVDSPPPSAAAGDYLASMVAALPGSTLTGDTSIAVQLADRINNEPESAMPAAGPVQAALILLADHGLAASTTAARLAAAYGGNLHGVIGAGLAVLAGSRHGAASSGAEHLFRRSLAGDSLGDLLVEHEGSLPWLGHPLYPEGDPRYLALRDAIEAAHPDAVVLDFLDRLEIHLARKGLPPPNIDAALAALTIACDLKPASGEVVFAVARMAGWVAHAIEAKADKPVRLRATYTGPRPVANTPA